MTSSAGGGSPRRGLELQPLVLYRRIPPHLIRNKRCKYPTPKIQVQPHRRHCVRFSTARGSAPLRLELQPLVSHRRVSPQVIQFINVISYVSLFPSACRASASPSKNIQVCPYRRHCVIISSARGGYIKRTPALELQPLVGYRRISPQVIKHSSGCIQIPASKNIQVQPNRCHGVSSSPAGVGSLHRGPELQPLVRYRRISPQVIRVFVGNLVPGSAFNFPTQKIQVRPHHRHGVRSSTARIARGDSLLRRVQLQPLARYRRIPPQVREGRIRTTFINDNGPPSKNIQVQPHRRHGVSSSTAGEDSLRHRSFS